MAYNPSVAALTMIAPMGLVAVPSTGASISGGGSIYRYCSTHGATEIVATGFFSKCGRRPLNWTGVSRGSTNDCGVVPGDVILAIESSGGAAPGRVTFHGVLSSTFSATTSGTGLSENGAGWDISVRAHAST